MQLRKLSTTLAMLAATAGVSVFAASAQAVVVDNDSVSLTSDSEVKLTDANLAFDFSGGATSSRRSSAHSRWTTATTRVSGPASPATTRRHAAARQARHHALPPTPTPTASSAINLPEDADALTDSVIVSVEKDDGPQGTWTTKDERTRT